VTLPEGRENVLLSCPVTTGKDNFMRDTVNISGWISYQDEARTRDWRNGTLTSDWSPWRYKRNSKKGTYHQKVLKGRANISQSDHIQPTPYRAYDKELQPGDFSEEVWYDNGPQTPGQAGYHQQVQYRRVGSWAPASVPGSVTGLSGTYPYEHPLATNRAEARLSANVADAKIGLTQNIGELILTAGAMRDNARRGTLALLALARGDIRLMARHLGVRVQSRRTVVIDDIRPFPFGQGSISHRIHERPSYVQTLWDIVRDAPDLFNSYILAYRFGWQPLMTDLFNQREAILAYLNDEKFFVTAEGVGREVVPTYMVEDVHEGEIEYITHIRTAYKISDSHLSGLQKLGAINPAALAWELASYSFVVDWFTGIGDFLNGLTDFNGTTFHHGSKTIVSKAEATFKPDGTYVGPEPTPCRLSSFGMQRYVLSDFPTPSPRIRLDLDINKLTTIAQLLSQRI
jgi:hypothetical protein